MSMNETIKEAEKLLKQQYDDVQLLLEEEDGTIMTVIIKYRDIGSRLEIATKELTSDMLATVIGYQLTAFDEALAEEEKEADEEEEEEEYEEEEDD